MKIEIDVKGLDIVVSAINNLTSVLNNTSLPTEINSVKEVAPAKQHEKEKTQPKATKNVTTLEKVRDRLAALSQDGKQVQVKALITELGAKKLSDIPAGKYAELLKKAKEL
jgi:regulator of replication initiation timing